MASSGSNSTAPSSSFSSLRPSASNTASSTPWQSPSSDSRARSVPLSPKTWSGETGTGRRNRMESRSRDVGSMVDSFNDKSRTGALGQSSTAATQEQKSNAETAKTIGSGLVGFPKAVRTASNSSEQSNASSSREQWWEHVLPPGQLAERLRRAQATSTSTSSSSALQGAIVAEEGPRASRKSILRNATPSERKIWTSLADYGREEDRLAPPSRSEVNSTRSSFGSVSSMKSDMGSSLSGCSSGTEDSLIDARSPSGREETERSFAWDRSNTTSPTSMHSIVRSTTSRRRRVMSDAEVAVGLGIGGKQSNELDECFRQWNSNLPFESGTTSSAGVGSHHHLLRPFPSSRGGRQSPCYILADTPEASSAEEQDEDSKSIASTTTTTTTRRITRTSTSTMQSFETVAEPDRASRTSSSKRQSMPASTAHQWSSSLASQQQHQQLPRHVSFNQDVEVSGDEQLWQSHSVGRHAGRSHSLLNDTSNKRRSWQPDTARTLATSSTRQPRPHQEQALPMRGQRSTCRSAPTSPKLAFSSLSSDQVGKLNEQQKAKVVSTPDELALLASFSQAHTQLASAGSMALTLTRQLSVPLRPMLHLTMFLSISSFTCMALAGFLIAGYLVTAWDDVNSRGKRIQRNVRSAKKTFEAGVQWVLRGGGGEGETGEREEKPVRSSEEASSHRLSSSKLATAPIRFALAVPITIAHKLTPTSISETLGYGDQADKAGGDGTPLRSSNSPPPSSKPFPSRSAKPSSTFPPRPPLSSLLPSICLTIVIALGAGLASFFAQRASSSSPSSPAAASSPKFASTPSSSRPSTPLPHPSSQIPMRRKGSGTSQHSRKQSYQSSLREERRPYDSVAL